MVAVLLENIQLKTHGVEEEDLARQLHKQRREEIILVVEEELIQLIIPINLDMLAEKD